MIFPNSVNIRLYLVAVFKDIRASVAEQAAFRKVEKGWHDALRKRVTWFNYVINHLYEILFFLAALIMVYGFIRVFMKKRAYKDDDEDDDYGY